MKKKYIYLSIAIFLALTLWSALGDGLKTPLIGLINGLIPIVLAFFLAYLLDHGVTFFEKLYTNIGIHRKALRFLSVISGIFSLLLVIAGLFALVIPSVIGNGVELSKGLPYYSQKISSFLMEVDSYLSLPEGISLAKLFDSVNKEEIYNSVNELLSSALNLLSTLSVSILLAVMILLEKGNIKKALNSFCERAFRSPEKIKKGFYCIKVVLDGYLYGKLLECLSASILCLILYSLLGVPYAIILSILMFILYIVPYVGGYIALLPALFIAITISVPCALIVTIGVVVILNVVGTFISPLIYKNSLNISALTILASILIGGSVAGIIGFLSGPPIAAVIKLFLSVFVRSKKQEPNKNA